VGAEVADEEQRDLDRRDAMRLQAPSGFVRSGAVSADVIRPPLPDKTGHAGAAIPGASSCGRHHLPIADSGAVLDGRSDWVVPRQTSQVARPGDRAGAVCRQADVSRTVVVKSTYRPVCVAAWIPVVESLCLTRALDLPGLVAWPRSVAWVIICSGHGPRRGESDRRLIGESARCSVDNLSREVVPTLARVLR
jgi:hypothetical protein